jgi:hypothetical protein
MTSTLERRDSSRLSAFAPSVVGTLRCGARESLVILSRAGGEGPPNGSKITQTSSYYVERDFFVEREAILGWTSLRA